MGEPVVRPLRYFTYITGWLGWTVGWVGYLLFFSAVWGPIVAWKIALAVALYLGLGIGLAVGDPPDRSAHVPRRRSLRGLRAAQARARWPMSRRVCAFFSGVLLCVAGVGQSLGYEVDLRFYPLLSGLCTIVSVALGLPLVILACQAPGGGPAKHRLLGADAPARRR